MWQKTRHLLEMIRFSHTVFALPFALWAAVMAWSTPLPAELAGRLGHARPAFRWQELAGILLCMVCARSAAMAFNRLVDRRIDAANPRTAGRHLPAGILSVGAVVAFTAAMTLGFLAATLLFLPNRLPVMLAVPVLLFLYGYSFAKRFTSLAHVWLGMSLMLTPLCAWIALRGEAVLARPADMWPALLLGTAVLLWVTGFDVIYACQDTEFDRRAKLKSIPAAWGVRRSLRFAAACHALMVLVLAALPFVDRLGGPVLPLQGLYALSVLAVAALLCYEHFLVRPEDLTRVNVAFFQVNAVISLGLFLAGSLDLLLG